jgi:hypothetical protein
MFQHWTFNQGGRAERQFCPNQGRAAARPYRQDLRDCDRGCLVLWHLGFGADLMRELLTFLFDLAQVTGTDAVRDMDNLRIGTARFAPRANGDLQRELGLH